jgi:hypothetical protein
VGVGEYATVLAHPAIVTCPQCSYFVEGTCMVCPNGDPHPACVGCVDGRIPPPPWYKRELVYSILIATAATITAAVTVRQLKKIVKTLPDWKQLM